MTEQDAINEVFFKFLTHYSFDEKDLDYAVLEKYKIALQALSNISNSSINVFDISKLQVVFYSSNFGSLLGYVQSDYENIGQQFFANKIHPDDKLKLSLQGISTLKIFDSLTNDEKLNYKEIKEYRMMNSENKYIRVIEQYQIIELDKKGQIWLLMGVTDISPNQDEFNGIKVQLMNFRTGKTISLETAPTAQIELTKRETEVLKLVKDGFLSKEISNMLSISLHTVNTHRQRFLAKLGANNSFEAVMFASRFGLLE